jgi:hypothetical protein
MVGGLHVFSHAQRSGSEDFPRGTLRRFFDHKQGADIRKIRDPTLAGGRGLRGPELTFPK